MAQYLLGVEVQTDNAGWKALVFRADNFRWLCLGLFSAANVPVGETEILIKTGFKKESKSCGNSENSAEFIFGHF